MLPNFVLVPFENNVSRWNYDDLTRVGIEGIFTRHHRNIPDALIALFNHFAVFILITGKVTAFVAYVGDDNTDKSNFNDTLGNGLHSSKQSIDVIRAFNQNLQLATTTPTCKHTSLSVLEVVVIGRRFLWVIALCGGDNITLLQ